MRYLKTIIIIVLSFLFHACQKENLEVQKDTEFISFKPQLGVSGESWTRGKPLYSISNFGAIALEDLGHPIPRIYNLQVSYDAQSDEWLHGDPLTWAHYPSMDFYAYAPHNSYSENGITIDDDTYRQLFIKYTVPTNCADQPDLMVATPQKGIYNKIVKFEFEHALACVGFKVKGRFDEKITKIAIKGVSVSGMLNLDHTKGLPPQWSDIEAATDTEYTSGIKDGGITVGNSLADAMDVDGYLMMIPQKLGDDAKLIVTVDGVIKEVSLSGKEWKAGEQYTYNLDVAYDPIIIGYFGGWNGTEYTTQLQVDWELSKNDPLTQWATNNTTTGATNAHYGPTNINILKGLNADLSNYPAAKYCEDKNKGTGSDKGDNWYLPSENQLMAIWIAYESVPSKFSFLEASYWSATEYHVSASWFTNFGSGATFTYPKANTNSEYRVRCVRDVTPQAS